MEKNFITPAHIFNWAKEFTTHVNVIEKINFKIDSFVTELDHYSALFHDGKQTLLCSFDVEEKAICFWEVMNFDQLLSEHRDLTLLYLKNGEELYKELTGDLATPHNEVIYPA